MQNFLFIIILLGSCLLIQQHGSKLPDPLQAVLAKDVMKEPMPVPRLLLTVTTCFVIILAGTSFLNRKNLGRPQKIFNPLNRHPGSSKPEPGC
jgi:hypothetical protein